MFSKVCAAGRIGYEHDALAERRVIAPDGVAATDVLTIANRLGRRWAE